MNEKKNLMNYYKRKFLFKVPSQKFIFVLQYLFSLTSGTKDWDIF